MTSPNTVMIDGVTYDVIVREPAKSTTPISGGEAIVFKTIDMLLLSNDDVVYQCVHPAALGKCEFVRDNVASVTAHQRSHGAKTVAKQAAAKLDAVAAKEQAEFERRSAGMNASNELKRKRYEAEVTSTDPRIARIQKQLSDLAVAIEKIAATLPPLAGMVRALNEEVGAIVLAEAAKKTGVDVTKLTTEEKFELMKKLMS